MVRQTEIVPGEQANRRRVPRGATVALLAAVGYVLSSGPVLATAFWLREATHWDGFYLAMWLYAPLLYFHPHRVIDGYIGWWCELFDTVGPG